MSAAITEPMTNCLACNAPQNTEPATLCEHCLAKATVLLRQGHTPAQIALGRDDIRAVLEGWQESREKSTMPKATNKTKKTVSRETPEATLAVAEDTKAARSIAILIPIDAIEANPYQPRKIFSEQEMQELVDSIKEHGVLQPILVRPNPEDETRYQLIAGERRWRASQEAGLVKIEAVVRQKVSDQVMAEMAIIENVQRHDMSVIEQAIALRRLITEFNLTADYLAQRIGLSRSVVSNRLRLLDLTLDVQERIAKGELSEAHGRALVKYKKFPDFVSFYAGHIAEYSLPSKLIESGIVLAGWEMTWAERRELKEQLISQKLFAELDYCDSGQKADDLLFEHPDSIFRGRWQRDDIDEEEEDPDLFCLDVKLAGTLHKQWEQYREEKDNSNDSDTRADELLKQALATAQAGEIVLLKDLGYGQMKTIYAGNCPKTCTKQCECRAKAKYDEDSTNITDICLNPARYEKLQKEEAAAKKQKRSDECNKLLDGIEETITSLNANKLRRVPKDCALYPVLVVDAFINAKKTALVAAARALEEKHSIYFNVTKFKSLSRPEQMEMLSELGGNLPEFAAMVLVRSEIERHIENDFYKPDLGKWLLKELKVVLNGD